MVAGKMRCIPDAAHFSFVRPPPAQPFLRGMPAMAGHGTE